jgi:DNA mismatch repair protein MutS2
VAGAARGQLQRADELAGILTTLQAARRIRSFVSSRVDRVPLLSGLADLCPDLRRLEERLARAVTPEGEIRDDATPELRRARRRVRDLEAQIDRRMTDRLKDPAIVACLQDRYATQRSGRPVLPIRADARSRVRGIVHDVSSSGTTVFVEPEELVELGNRLRVASTEVEREIDRILRELSGGVAAEAGPLESVGDVLERLDLAIARGRLSQRLASSAPEIAPGSPLALLLLRHPLLCLEGGMDPADVVPNDVVLPESVRALVISGPNAGGKTVVAKAVGLAVLAVRAGLHVPCLEGSRLGMFDRVFADIGDEQDLRAGLSTFSARMTNLARILEEAGPGTLVILDEVGEGTEPGEGAAIAQAVLEALVDRDACVIATTHFNRLKELAGEDSRFLNASAEFDRETLLPTYRIHLGMPGSSGASWVAERMGVSADVVERSRALMDQDDRKLEALTRTLSELRQELEAERQIASRVREETESVRGEYEERLSTLRTAREKALASMKADVEEAFRGARAEIARVVRALQRGDRADGRAANEARDALEQIRRRTEEATRGEEKAPPPAPRESVDWERLRPGDHVEIEGVSGEAALVEGPDRRGRVTVRIGGIRSVVQGDRVIRARRAPARRAAAIDVERAPEAYSVREECDLRGLRVDEALERADAHLQRALGTTLRRVVFIHGHGTGALREAVRCWLGELPYIGGFEPGAPNEGGNGVTVALLSDPS